MRSERLTWNNSGSFRLKGTDSAKDGLPNNILDSIWFDANDKGVIGGTKIQLMRFSQPEWRRRIILVDPIRL